MTRLFLYPLVGGAPGAPQLVSDPARLGSMLGSLGVEYAKWTALKPLPPAAGQAEILELHRAQLDEVTSRFGYQSVDVVRMQPDNPQAEVARQKFLSEHTHADDEARFFAEGGGTFYLHFPERALVGALACTEGDWVRVPAGTRHWFDMGARPLFSAIRLFTRPDGWVASFTGSPIAAAFPTHDALAAS